jgi:hypothetical protein
MKIKQKIILWLLKQMGFKREKETEWKPGYIRIFTIIWYPKEGWVNIFHNCESNEEIQQMLKDACTGEPYGQPMPKDSVQIVRKAQKRAD